MANSTIAQLVLYLHEQARAEGRVTERDEVADQVLWVLQDEDWQPAVKFADLPLGIQVGLELRRGRAFTEEAKRIRQVALAKLRDFEVMLAAIDAIGFTPQLVRAALTLHWERLESEELGTDGNCVFIDLQAARARAPEDVRQVVDLLPMYGPQDIGEQLETNGSRLVGRAMGTMSRILEGKYSGKSRRRRRRKGKGNGDGATEKQVTQAS